MFGQYDGAAVFNLPDSHSMAAVSLAITSSGALSRFETHETDRVQRPDRDRRTSQRDHLPAAGYLTVATASPQRLCGAVDR
jgi:GYD domain